MEEALGSMQLWAAATTWQRFQKVDGMQRLRCLAAVSRAKEAAKDGMAETLDMMMQQRNVLQSQLTVALEKRRPLGNKENVPQQQQQQLVARVNKLAGEKSELEGEVQRLRKRIQAAGSGHNHQVGARQARHVAAPERRHAQPPGSRNVQAAETVPNRAMACHKLSAMMRMCSCVQLKWSLQSWHNRVVLEEVGAHLSNNHTDSITQSETENDLAKLRKQVEWVGDTEVQLSLTRAQLVSLGSEVAAAETEFNETLHEERLGAGLKILFGTIASSLRRQCHAMYMKWRVFSSVESATRSQRQVMSAQRAASSQARQEATKRDQSMSVMSSEVRELRKMQKASVGEVARLQSELAFSKDEFKRSMSERESLSEALRDRKKHAANQVCMKQVEADQAREEIVKLQAGNKTLNRKVDLIFKQLHTSTEEHGEAIATYNVALLFAATRQQQSFVSHQVIQHWYHVHAFGSQTANLLASQQLMKDTERQWNKKMLLSFATRRISSCLHEALNHLENAARLGSLLFAHSSKVKEASVKKKMVSVYVSTDELVVTTKKKVEKAVLVVVDDDAGTPTGISMDEVVAGVFDFPASPDQPQQQERESSKDETAASSSSEQKAKPSDDGKSQSDLNSTSTIGPFGRRRLGVRDTKARVARITGVVSSLTNGLDFVQHSSACSDPVHSAKTANKAPVGLRKVVALCSYRALRIGWLAFKHAPPLVKRKAPSHQFGTPKHRPVSRLPTTSITTGAVGAGGGRIMRTGAKPGANSARKPARKSGGSSASSVAPNPLCSVNVNTSSPAASLVTAHAAATVYSSTHHIGAAQSCNTGGVSAVATGSARRNHVVGKYEGTTPAIVGYTPDELAKQLQQQRGACQSAERQFSDGPLKDMSRANNAAHQHEGLAAHSRDARPVHANPPPPAGDSALRSALGALSGKNLHGQTPTAALEKTSELLQQYVPAFRHNLHDVVIALTGLLESKSPDGAVAAAAIRVLTEVCVAVGKWMSREVGYIVPELTAFVAQLSHDVKVQKAVDAALAAVVMHVPPKRTLTALIAATVNHCESRNDVAKTIAANHMLRCIHLICSGSTGGKAQVHASSSKEPVLALDRLLPLLSQLLVDTSQTVRSIARRAVVALRSSLHGAALSTALHSHCNDRDRERIEGVGEQSGSNKDSADLVMPFDSTVVATTSRHSPPPRSKHQQEVGSAVSAARSAAADAARNLSTQSPALKHLQSGLSEPVSMPSPPPGVWKQAEQSEVEAPAPGGGGGGGGVSCIAMSDHSKRLAAQATASPRKSASPMTTIASPPAQALSMSGNAGVLAAKKRLATAKAKANDFVKPVSSPSSSRISPGAVGPSMSKAVSVSPSPVSAASFIARHSPRQETEGSDFEMLTANEHAAPMMEQAREPGTRGVDRAGVANVLFVDLRDVISSGKELDNSQGKYATSKFRVDTFRVVEGGRESLFFGKLAGSSILEWSLKPPTTT